MESLEHRVKAINLKIAQNAKLVSILKTGCDSGCNTPGESTSDYIKRLHAATEHTKLITMVYSEILSLTTAHGLELRRKPSARQNLMIMPYTEVGM